MTVSELYRFLENKIPKRLSCEWDNDGLMCCPDPDRDVKKVLLALDITEAIVNEAQETGCDVILSHHPLVFRPVKALTTEGGVPRKLIRLVKNGISAMSFHTQLDAVGGGVNDVLAATLGLENVCAFGPEGEQMGRIGNLAAPLSLEVFAEQVKKTLGAPFVLVSGGGQVSRVAVLGGEGDDFIGAAEAAGADVLVSGRLGYHPMTDAPEGDIALIEAGHYYTERPVLSALAAMVKEADGGIETIIAESGNIKAI